MRGTLSVRHKLHRIKDSRIKKGFFFAELRYLINFGFVGGQTSGKLNEKSSTLDDI